jgi:hypothetical protein
MEWVSMEFVERWSRSGRVGLVLEVEEEVGLDAASWEGEGKENDLTFDGE